MPDYAQVESVRARLPYRTLDASSDPSQTQVEEWILEAEANVNGMLTAIGVSSPCTDSTGRKILAGKAASYAEGRVRMAFAAAGGDGDNEDGRFLIEEFNEFLQDMNDNSAKWIAMLGGGGSAGTGQLRGYDGSDDDATFTTDEVF